MFFGHHKIKYLKSPLGFSPRRLTIREHVWLHSFPTASDLLRKIRLDTIIQGDRTSKREVFEPQKGDKRYAQGQFTESQVNVWRSSAADRRSKSKTVAAKGQGDRGDQKKS
jgi:hypothetical protein